MASAMIVDDTIGLDEKEGYFSLIQTTGQFSELSEEEIYNLADGLSVLRFDEGETVIKKGEEGTWFGIVLSGSLVVEGSDRVIESGALLGEASMLQEAGALRSATMKGHTAGVLAALLVSDLPQFAADSPLVGTKLMQMMAKSALAKEMANLRGSRALCAPPITFAQDSLNDELLHSLLSEKGFADAEAKTVCALVTYRELSAGEVLATAGQQLAHVVFVLKGTVKLDAFNFEVMGVQDECHNLRMVGTTELFGETLLSDTSSICAVSDKVLVAGIARTDIDELLGEGTELSHKLLHLFGQSAMRLSSGIEALLSAGAGHTAHVFSIPFNLKSGDARRGRWGEYQSSVGTEESFFRAKRQEQGTCRDQAVLTAHSLAQRTILHRVALQKQHAIRAAYEQQSQQLKNVLTRDEMKRREAYSPTTASAFAGTLVGFFGLFVLHAKLSEVDWIGEHLGESVPALAAFAALISMQMGTPWLEMGKLRPTLLSLAVAFSALLAVQLLTGLVALLSIIGLLGDEAAIAPNVHAALASSLAMAAFVQYQLDASPPAIVLTATYAYLPPSLTASPLGVCVVVGFVMFCVLYLEAVKAFVAHYVTLRSWEKKVAPPTDAKKKPPPYLVKKKPKSNSSSPAKTTTKPSGYTHGNGAAMV